MVEHTEFAVKILKFAFPGCEGLYAFDNASNHCPYTPNALTTTKMNLGPGGKQPVMRDGWDYAQNLSHPMVFSQNNPDPKLRGQPKGIRKVILERGLWQDRRWDGSKFLLSCPKGTKGPGCDPGVNGECCSITLHQSQKDFKEQKGALQELVETAGHSVIFYLKFHCELNFIERFWRDTKHYTGENCGYTLDGLRKTIPVALQSVPVATINCHYHHCVRTIEAYKDGFQYGTKEFVERAYKSHRQVVSGQVKVVRGLTILG